MKFNAYEIANKPDRTRCSSPVCAPVEDGSLLVSWVKKGEVVARMRDAKGKWSDAEAPVSVGTDPSCLILDFDGACVSASVVGSDEKRIVVRRAKKDSKLIKCAELRLPDNYRREGVKPVLSSPCLWTNDGGKSVHMLMSTSAGFIFRADSYDGGRKWNTPFPLNVASSGAEMALAVKDNRDFYLVCNPSASKLTPLALYQSGTDGCTYKRLSVIASGEGRFAEPYMCYDAGRLYVTFVKNDVEVMLAVIEL